MKIKTEDILIANVVFNGEKYAEKAMSMKVSLWFARNAKETATVTKIFRDATRVIFQELATGIEEKDGSVSNHIPEDKMEEYRERVFELAQENVDIDIYTITEEEFGDFKLSPKDTLAVLYTIE